MRSCLSRGIAAISQLRHSGMGILGQCGLQAPLQEGQLAKDSGVYIVRYTIVIRRPASVTSTRTCPQQVMKRRWPAWRICILVRYMQNFGQVKCHPWIPISETEKPMPRACFFLSVSSRRRNLSCTALVLQSLGLLNDLVRVVSELWAMGLDLCTSQAALKTDQWVRRHL